MALASGEEGWMAPGYAKQLRDILMPLSGLLVLFAIRRRPGGFVFLFLALVPIIALLMISSGERGSVLLFLAAVCWVAARTVRRRTLSATVVLGPLAVTFLIAGGTFFALTSSFTSRDYEDSSTALILADRVVTRTPEENVLGARAWNRGAPFPGAGWVSELASVLPGTQQTLSNLIHEDLGGGNLGNSVLGMWIDVYYNFGWLLGLIAAFMVGVSMAFFNHWVNTKRARSWSADICGLWLSVCMFMVLSPFLFLLYGPFLLSVVLWLMQGTKTRGSGAFQGSPGRVDGTTLNPSLSPHLR